MPTPSPDALLTVEAAVRAVLDHDDTLLAPDADDLYVWIRDYGSHGAVDLVLPPGAAEDSDIDWTETHDGDAHVAIGMWTRQEGRSDLTLELRLRSDDRGLASTDHGTSRALEALVTATAAAVFEARSSDSVRLSLFHIFMGLASSWRAACAEPSAPSATMRVRSGGWSASETLPCRACRSGTVLIRLA